MAQQEPKANARPGHRDLRNFEVLVLITVLVLGAGLRLTYLAEIRHDPGLRYPGVDAGFNLYWAQGLATGDWTLPPDANGRDPRIRETAYQRAPGYPLVLAVLYRFTGGDPLLIRAIQMLGGLAAVLLSWWVGRRLFSPSVGLVWAGFSAVNWGFIYFEAGLNGAWLLHLLFLILLLVSRRIAISDRLIDAALLGALVGMMALVRSNALLLGPILGVWMLVVVRRRRGVKPALVALAAAALAGILVLTLAIVRNYRVSGHFVPISANAGLTLYHGNNRSATGTSTAALGKSGFFASPWHSADIVARASERAGREISYVEASAQAGRDARAWMRANPAEALRLVGIRALLFWGPHELAHSTPVAADRLASPLLRKLPFSFSLIIAGGLWGILMWLLARRRAAFAPLPDGTGEAVAVAALVVGGWFLSFLPFFVSSLYRASVVPALLLAFAVGVVATAGLARSGQRRSAVVGVAVLAVLLMVARVPVIAVDAGETERLVLRGSQWRMQGDLITAERKFREALRLTPDSPGAMNGLATVLLDTDRFGEAVPLLDAALRLNPGDPNLNFNLGLAHLQLKHWLQAIALFSAATELSPNLVEPHVLLGSSYEGLGDSRSAIGSYDRALDLDPDHLQANNNLAWLLATARTPELRNGERAVELAERSVAVLRVPATLDTLAAALAEAGRFDEAVTTVEEAIRSNQHEAAMSADDLEARKKLYQSGRPYRS